MHPIADDHCKPYCTKLPTVKVLFFTVFECSFSVRTYKEYFQRYVCYWRYLFNKGIETIL